jgi:transcriptional regulator with GAF, ATPase, and Fis domain
MPIKPHHPQTTASGGAHRLPLDSTVRRGRGSQGWNSSRLLVAALSTGIIVYSSVVILYVATTGDPGLRCVFGKLIKDVDEGREWKTSRSAELAGPDQLAPGYQWSDHPPERGSILQEITMRSARSPRILDVYTIEHYTDYVKALRALRDRIGQSIVVKWRSPDGQSGWVGETIVRRPSPRTYFWSVVWFLQEMMIFAVVARAFWTRPHDVAARLFFWLCVLTVGAFMGGYHWSQIVIYRPLIFLFAAFAVFLPSVSLHFYLVFPRRNPVLERHGKSLLRLIYGFPAVALVGLWLSMGFTALVRDSGGRELENGLFVVQSLALGYIGLAVVFFVLCLACLAYSYRRASSRIERNQVKWILLATLLALVPISYLMWDVWHDPARLGLARSGWPMFLVSLLYTLAYAMSITRYKLMQAGEVFDRGVIYFLVSLAAGLLYSGVLVVSALAFGDTLIHNTSTGALVAGFTALVLLLLSEAARQRIQKVIDRRFYREKYKLDQAMRKMSHAVGSLVDRNTLGRRLLEAAEEVLRIEWGALYLGEPVGGPLALIACQGPEPEDRVLAENNPLVQRLRTEATIRLPHAMALVSTSDPATDAMIALGGEVVTALEADGTLAGLLVLGPKRSGMPYEDEEVAFLGALGSVATLALHSADIHRTLEGLNHELHDKVEKIAEQQRRILILQDQLVGRPATSGPATSGTSIVPRAETTTAGALTPIKGSSKAVKRMLEISRKVAASPSAVLIRGESGTGKELLAEAIHAQSPRANGPFVKVHCAALSQNLLESELFGHVKGAFTGADRDRIGRFQQADGGTLFLDEIGDIHWDVQTKLLRVLQEMTFERVGSSTSMTVNVRILAATHQDLEALIRAGKFREDLYYRLNVIPIRTPSLRERQDDIFELAVHFLGQHSHRMGKAVTRLDESAVEALMAHDWPGNIRELENVIERAVVLSDGPALSVDDLPQEVRRTGGQRRARRLAPAGVLLGEARSRARPANPTSDDSNRTAVGFDGPDELDLEAQAYEKRRLTDALADAGGVKSEAARLLGMPRSTFFSKLRKHGLA